MLVLFWFPDPNLVAQGTGWNNQCNRPIRIRSRDNLRFGEFAVTSNGSVTIDTSGTPSTSGGIIFLGGQTSSARFRVRGCPNTQYHILLPDFIELRSRRNRMRLDNFTSDPDSIGLLDNSGRRGRQDLYVGGTLNANTGQPAGRYRGRFRVEVILE